jgi:dipeptidyl aminopeptidase/acylaminoacyl peptidase
MELILKSKRAYAGWIIVTVAGLLLLAACSTQPDVNLATVTPLFRATFTLVPASRTPVPTPTGTATATPTLVPTATATLHPLSIDSMRAGKYPGSEFVIEQELPTGSNYKRYIASYQSEGLKIFGLLTIPKGEKPASGWPMIVFNHGYIPPKEYRTTERYIAYVDTLARNGYIVFRSDYRGHDNSEGEARGAYGSPDYVIDVLNALAALKRLPEADLNRIGMWGHSMGGYITLRAMVISKDIKAGVIWGGVVASYPDMQTKWTHGPGTSVRPTPASGTSWRSSLTQIYGSPEQNPQFWGSISANSYLLDISGPLQLHHGMADSEVPLEFSETLYYQMLAVGKYVELYKYDGDNHNISNYFTAAMQRSVEFFDRFVKNP